MAITVRLQNKKDYILTNDLRVISNIEILKRFDFVTDHRLISKTRQNKFCKIPNRESIAKHEHKRRFAEDTVQLIKRRKERERISTKTPETKILLAETRKLVKKHIRREIKLKEEQLTIETMETGKLTKRLRKELVAGKTWMNKQEENGSKKCKRHDILKIARCYYKNL